MPVLDVSLEREEPCKENYELGSHFFIFNFDVQFLLEMRTPPLNICGDKMTSDVDPELPMSLESVCRRAVWNRALGWIDNVRQSG